MKTITYRFKNQQGAASLLTALVLLISITLVILLTSKEVLVETKVTADNYRTSQATAAASAAMNQAEAYFMAGGLDQRVNATGVAGADELVDYTSALPFSLNLTVGGQTTTAQFYFDNSDDNACDCQADVSRDIDNDGDGDCFGTLGRNMTRTRIIATGWSDDNTAVRTVTQCLGTFDIFDGGNGPKQPFVSKASVGVFGNATIINRYTNSSIWTGGANDISGAAFATYLRPSNTATSDYTKLELNSDCEVSPCGDPNNPGPNTQMVSNKDAGAGIDIITDDATLSSKTADQFFDMFFALTKAQFMKVAENVDQKLPNAAGVTSPNGMSGVIWVEGNLTLNAGDVVGSPATPAVLVVNGDFSLSGGATVYGVIYVTGALNITGNPVIKGSVIGESNTTSGGGGTLKLVYVPIVGDDQAPPFIVGTGAIVPGSWKDW
jgi:Tfp pilus assembly protein PilX